MLTKQDSNHSVSSTHIFNSIFNKENNFVRLPRKPFFDFAQLNHCLDRLSFPKTSIELWNYSEKIQSIFSSKLNNCDGPDEREALKLLKEDILSLVLQSFELSDDYTPHEISLSAVKGVPCTKFHADFLPLRLICTYLGPGTIFLPKESTRYPCLNEGSANKRVLKKGSPSYQASPFEILLLKGRKFNKGELKPCAHRSPEIEGQQLRLIFKVDFK